MPVENATVWETPSSNDRGDTPSATLTRMIFVKRLDYRVLN